MKRILCLILIFCTLCLNMVSCAKHEKRQYAKDLNEAIAAENFETVRQIIAECPDSVNTYPTVAPGWWQAEMLMTTIYYPLSEACKTGNLEMVKLLVESGADVNSHNPDRYVVTPIHVALLFNEGEWYDIVMYLIDNGASIDYINKDADGKGAMVIYIREWRINGSQEDEKNLDKLFAYVLENCDTTNVNWPRVIFQAVSWERHNMTQMLIEGGYCDVNERYSGKTPLMYAISRSDAKMVKYLLDNGADINAVDEDGKTVFDYVAECDNEEIKALFK